MLGVHFATDRTVLVDQIEPALTVLGVALEATAGRSDEDRARLTQSNVSCAVGSDSQWAEGGRLYRLLREVRVESRDASSTIAFNSDGSRKVSSSGSRSGRRQGR